MSEYEELEKLITEGVSDILDSFVFEFNVQETRNYILDILKLYFEKFKEQGKISLYEIVCDETNNTPDVLIQNILIVDTIFYIGDEKVKAKYISGIEGIKEINSK